MPVCAESKEGTRYARSFGALSGTVQVIVSLMTHAWVEVLLARFLSFLWCSFLWCWIPEAPESESYDGLAPCWLPQEVASTLQTQEDELCESELQLEVASSLLRVLLSCQPDLSHAKRVCSRLHAGVRGHALQT